MIHIYHSTNFRNTSDGIGKWFTEADCKAAFLNNEYALVATIGKNAGNEDVASLDNAYAITQHVNEAWTDNDDVALTVYDKDTPKRSTSVGDILLTGDGEFFMVDGIGFSKLKTFN